MKKIIYTLLIFPIYIYSQNPCFNRLAFTHGGSNGSAMVQADLNNDSILDLAVADMYILSILNGDGDGNFTLSAQYTNTVVAACSDLIAADFNKDNNIDLVVSFIGGPLLIYNGNGDGTFLAPIHFSGYYAYCLTYGDFDSDNDLDIAIGTSSASMKVGILLNDGNGAFASPIPYTGGLTPKAIVTGYFNNDSILDIATAANNVNSGYVYIYMGNGDATFGSPTSYSTGAGAKMSSIAIGNLNNDSFLDIVATADPSDEPSNQGFLYVLLNSGTGTFSSPLQYFTNKYPNDVVIVDVNGDGSMDIACARSNNGQSVDALVILLGDGTGNFSVYKAYPTQTNGHGPTSIIAGYLNNDSVIDFALLDQNGSRITVYLNEPFSISAITTNPSCFGNCNGSLLAIPNGGSSPYQYFWQPGSKTTATINNLCAGSYTVSVTENNGCFNSQAFTLQQPGILTSTITTNPSSCIACPDGMASAAVTGGTSPYSFLWSSQSSNATISGLFPRSYSVSITDSHGCNVKNDMVVSSSSGYVACLDDTTYNNTGSLPRSVITGHFNVDAYTDIAVANNGNHNISIFLGTSSGKYLSPVNYPCNVSPFSITKGDFDKDNDTDLVVANYFGNAVSILKNNGSAVFAAPTSFTVGTYPFSVISGHFNGDSNLDLAVANSLDNSVSMLFGTGFGTFAQPINYYGGKTPIYLESSLINNDNFLDLVIVNSGSDSVIILTGDGNGVFSFGGGFTSGGISPVMLTIADFDRDNDQDIAVANFYDGHISVRFNNGTGAFSTPTNYQAGLGPQSIISSDFNSDSYIDLAIANYGSNSLSILHGNGNGIFAPPLDFPLNGNGYAMAKGKLNGDTISDIVVTLYNSQSMAVFLSCLLPPIANFTANVGVSLCENTCVQFSDLSINNPTSFSWIFPGGMPSTSNSQNPNVCYSQAGNYNVELIVGNTKGVDTLLQASYIQVNPSPTAAIIGNVAICMGSSTTLTGSGGISYVWEPGTIVASSANFNSSGTITLTVTNINNCKSTATTDINVSPSLIVNLGNDTILCSDSLILNANNAGSLYLWSTGKTTQSIEAKSSGAYWVNITNNFGCSNSDTLNISFANCALVWPGDANNDLIANNLDLLSVGMYFGETGFVRDSISNLWMGHNCDDWDSIQINNMNLKFADCNGDGTINSDDTLAININYAFTHNKKEQTQKTEAGDPDIYFVMTNTLVSAGSDVETELWLGNIANPVTNIYGLAFDISYNGNLIQTGATSISIPNSFIGTQGTDAIRLSREEEINGKIYAAITRTDHNNISGFGKIATIKMKTDSTISSNSNLQLGVSNYKAIDATGTPITFNTPVTNLAITPTSINEILNNYNVKIFPNPSTGKFNLQVENVNAISNFNIEIVDVIGNEIFNQIINKSISELDISNQSKGIYFIKITNSKGYTAVQKIVIQ